MSESTEHPFRPIIFRDIEDIPAVSLSGVVVGEFGD